VDDVPPVGVAKGWVANLIVQVKGELARELGRAEALSVWFDHSDLRGNSVLTPEILGELRASATLLLVLSKGYLASEWCRQELTTFVEKWGQNSPRLFVVERSEVQRPDEIGDLRGYRFWYADDNGRLRTHGDPEPDPDQRAYYDSALDLARDLAGQLRGLREGGDRIPPQATMEVRPPVVFLAQVPHALHERREQARRYLEQLAEPKVSVLPAGWLPLGNLRAALAKDLAASRLFVQLLDADSGSGLCAYQYEQAVAAGVPVLQWRDPSLPVEAIEDPAHRALLEGAGVQAMGFQEFLAMAERKLRPPVRSRPPPQDVLVFVDAAPEDMPLAHALEDVLRANGIAYALPLEITETTNVAAVREDLEQNLTECDAVVVLYADSPAVWVNRQILQCRKMLGRRDRPLKVLAVYSTPATGAAPKPKLNLWLPQMQLIECAFSEFRERLPELLLGGATP
jgi:hypothetical protein